MPRKLTLEDFIQRAREVHDNKYDYSKVTYVNANTKVCIICPEHGEFWQTPDKHTTRGHGCPKCCKTGVKSNTESFIQKSREVHGNKYDYSKVEYINNHTKVCIICPEHGEFWQIPNSHLDGAGCFECSYIERGKNKRLTTDEFIKRAREIHGDKYDYSKVEYSTLFRKVCIICPKHGEVWQTPASHLHGFGCPKCHQSFMERSIETFLEKNNIDYVYECTKKTLPWLENFRLDFYLPGQNVAIECQGKQHFEVREKFGGEIGLKERLNSDKRKKELCENNNVKVLYYANYTYNFPYKVFTSKSALLDEVFGGYK